MTASPSPLAPESGRFVGRVHNLPVRIYYEDTDFSGVVYHANYLRYFERGRSDFLRAAGVAHAALLEEDNPTAFSVVEMALAFKKPARIDDALIVATRFDAVAGPRLLIRQEILRGADVLTTADVQACCIALTGRPKKPPRSMVERLKPFLDPSLSSF